MTDAFFHTYQYWRAGGPLLAPIALASLGIWTCFLRSHRVLARTLKEGRGVREALESHGRKAKRVPLDAAVKALEGGIANMLGLVMRDISGGTRPLDAFFVRERECIELLRRDFLLLSVFTAVAPLLGLLGTVMGMIETFEAVSAVSGNTGGRVAVGISRALITTQFGLVVALPGVFGLARLERMLRNTEVLIANCRVHMLDMLDNFPGRRRS